MIDQGLISHPTGNGGGFGKILMEFLVLIIIVLPFCAGLEIRLPVRIFALTRPFDVTKELYLLYSRRYPDIIDQI
jgi:hypothetical protein